MSLVELETKKSLLTRTTSIYWTGLDYIFPNLVGNGSVNTLLLQQKIVRVVVFYAVRVVSNTADYFLPELLFVMYFFIASGVGLSPLYCGHFWPIVPTPDDR
jgi:hypothetical protein